MRHLARTLVAAFAGLGAIAGPAAAAPTALTLINGWTGAPFGTSLPEVETVSAVVHLKGGIKTAGSNSQPFVLPAAFRPSGIVFLPVDIGVGHGGRIVIDASGTATVEAPSAEAAAARAFTSLDGASFAQTAAGYTPLTLINGWTGKPFGTRAPAARALGNIVHLQGAIATTGSNPIPFNLPAAFRPSTQVFVTVDMCNGTNGRLMISSSGAVTVQAESGAFSNAACFTSLEGVTYALNATGFTALTLQSSWTGAPFGTSAPAVTNASGVVRFKGAMAGGSTSSAFVLPAAFRPTKLVILPLDMCDATVGRMVIATTGAVKVQAESSFSNANCFTSLDGAWFLR